MTLYLGKIFAQSVKNILYVKCKTAENGPDSFNLSNNEEVFTVITLEIWEKDYYINK